MATFTFQDGVNTVIASGPAFAPTFPALTGDVLTDTLNAQLAIRLAVALAGPKITYTVHGHNYDWTNFLKYLDDSIMKIRKEIAQSSPFEEIGMGL